MPKEPLSIKFGTDGIRGVVGETLTDLTVAIVAEATLRYWFRKHRLSRVLVGYDTRLRSRDFAEIIASIAHGHGLDVSITSAPTPTPVVSWAVTRHRFDLAFQVTASHNPPEYNGVKVLGSDGAPLEPEDTDGIERVIAEEYSDIERSVRDIGYGGFSTMDLRGEYIDHVSSWLLGVFKPGRRLKVLVDPIHGTAVGYTAEILRRLGFDVVEVNSSQEPNFGGKLPNPEPDQLRGDIDAVIGGKYDLAIAHDGDADRVAIVTRDLGFVDANKIIPIFTKALWEMSMVKRGVARTVATTHLIDDLASEIGLNVPETPVGIKYVVRAIREGRADIGGEESGGLAYLWHIPEKDGIYSGALGACIEATMGLGSIYSHLRSRFGERFYARIGVKANDPKGLVARISGELRSLMGKLGEVVRFIDIDGIKAVYSDKSWILVRGSGTESLIRIYSESLSRERTNALMDAVVGLIKRYTGSAA